MVSMRLVSDFWRQSVAYTRQRTALINRMVAADMLWRDMQEASQSASDWPHLSVREIVWHNGTQYIGWSFDNSRLLRKYGSYNPKNNQWHSSTTSLIAFPVKTVQFSFNKDKDCIGSIQMLIKDECGQLTTLIPLLKKRIVWQRK